MADVPTGVHTWLAQFALVAQSGRTMQIAPPAPERARSQAGPGKCCVILSPHPDDECIVGGLPLRLLREQGWRVVNIAITHGSKPERQLPRAHELAAACDRLGFENILLAPRGLQRVTAHSRQIDPAHWAACVQALAPHIERLRPDLLVLPHPQDAQAAHIGTHLLGLEVLAQQPAAYAPWVAFSEFWSTMASPNLMVQISPDDLADQIAALMQHEGEIRRNPYHLSLPAWMMDNVRRGAEQVGLPGSLAPDFMFATLYRVMRWQGGVLQPAWETGRFAAIGQPGLGMFQ